MRKIEYVIQNKEIFISLLRKTKKICYENLNEKSAVDNKLFWKTVKPLLSDKVAGTHLVENNELVKTDLETAEVLNNFFSNIIQNLDLPRYSNNEPLLSNSNDATTLKVILKYRNHPSIISIQNKCKDKGSFSFNEVDQKQIVKEFLGLDANKASESSDIPKKVLKENANIFSNFLCSRFSNSIFLFIFSVIALTIVDIS